MADKPSTPAAVSGGARARRRLLNLADAVALVLGLPLLALLLLPLLALAARAPLGLLLHYLADRATIQVILLSLATSLTSTVLVTVLGLPVAFLLARGRFRGRNVLEAIVELPIVLPPSVAGLALLMAFGRRGLLGPWLEAMGVEVAFTTAAVILAQTFVSAPYFIKAAAVGLSAVSSEFEEAAQIDGAGFFQTLRLVTVPLAWRGILGGATLSWARALGEFGATIMFAGNYPGRTRTMPLAVYFGFDVDLDQAIALGVILMLAAFSGLFIVRALLGRREPGLQ